MRIFFKYPLIVLISTFLVACGGGGGGSSSSSGGTTSSTTYTGQYIDAPTKGLIYSASPSGLSGTTDGNGSFSFRANDSVSFKIQAPSGTIDAGTIAPPTPMSQAIATTIVSVLNLPNGVSIAQTLQSLGGMGSLIDVSSTTPTVASLSTANTASLNNFIASGGSTTPPSIITVGAASAQFNANQALATINSTSGSASLSNVNMNNMLAFNQYNVTSLNQSGSPIAKGLGAGFGYFEVGGKLFNICSNQPPTQLSTGITWGSCDPSITTIGGQVATWTSNAVTTNGIVQSLNTIQTTTVGSQIGAVNTTISKYANQTSGSYTNAITNSPTIPVGYTTSGGGTYYVLQTSFGITQLTNKTIVISGDANCSNGQMQYIINSSGSAYTKTCKISSATGSSFTSATGALANNANLPGIVNFTDSGAKAADVKYIGVIAGSALPFVSGATGTLAIVTVGSSTACNLTSQSTCGIANLYPYSIP